MPAIYSMLAHAPAETQFQTDSLRFVVCGAAPMPAPLIPAVEERLCVVLVEGYGLSEGSCASTVNPLRGPRKPGTVGLALPGQTVAIVDDDGHQLPAGEPGEVVIAGPTVMRGYLGKPEETAKTVRDGWLHTGDVGYLDEDGYLVLVDRVKDMIIHGGENIYPKEIETVLHQADGVREAAVVGRADDVMGEVPVAFVSTTGPDATTTDDLLAFLGERLAPYKVPVAITVLDEVPKNPVGKIDKPALRARLVAAGTSTGPETRGDARA